MLRTLCARTCAAVLTGLALVALSASAAQAQEGAITGVVTNAQTLEPVNGAQVFIPDTDLGTLTDREGRYRLAPVPAGTHQIEVRLIGHRAATQTVTVQAGQTATLDIELDVSAVRLEDVTVNVVTGLERRRRQLGSNSGEINAEQVNKAVIQDFSNLLAGRTEGVILQDVSGTTGTSQRIRIRGSSSLSLTNEPLIIVDGIQFSGSQDATSLLTGGQDPSRLNDLNPEEIESIEIIKGPSAAALYGAVGANGVILITTKRGTPGGTDWHFYGEGGLLNDNTDYPANFVAVESIGDPSAPVFIEDGFNFDHWQRCENFSAAAGDCTQDQFLSFNTLLDPRTTPFRTGDRQRFGVNVGGGSTQSTYFISGEYQREDGIIDSRESLELPGEEFDYNSEKKWAVRTNLDAGLAEDLDASLSVGYVSRDVNFLSNDNSIFSPLLNGLIGMAGFVPGDDPNGGPNKQNFGFVRNLTDLGEASLSSQGVDRFTASVNSSYRPLEWLSAQGTFGVDIASTFEQINIQPGLDGLAADWVDGFRDATRSSRYNWTGNASLTGSFLLTDDIESVSTAGGSYQKEVLDGINCFGAGLVLGLASCDATTTRFDVGELFLDVVTVGGFFQQEFSWRDRLFVTGAVRMDDNSNFGGDAPIQVYPSASVSYLLSEEDWFPTGGAINELRLRGSWGVAGLRPEFRDAITLFGPVTATTVAGDAAGVTLTETGNDALKPERATEFEGGFDLGLFDDRLGLGLTYFRKTSKDALIEREIPGSFGLTTTFFENLGEVRNQGFEASLRGLALDSRNARASFTLQFTTLDNEVVALGEGVEPIVLNRGTQRHDEGFPAGAYFQDGYTFADANGDGLLSEDEVTVNGIDCAETPADCFIDEAIPTWTTSLSADIELFQFMRINTLFDARGGHSLVNDTERFRCNQFGSSGRGCAATGGQNTPLEEQARFIASRFLGTNAGFIEDAKFLKWRELAVTFTAPPSMRDLNPLLRRTSLTFAGRNLVTWTGYSGLDPEVNETGGNANFTSGEFNTQPPIQVFTVRLDVRF